MSSLRSDELERILHPVRNEDYMQEYAKAQVDLVHGALNLVEEGMPVDTVEREFWNHMDVWNQWLADQRGSLEWYTLTEGDLVRICIDDDPLPFFTSPENDAILERKYGIKRNIHSFTSVFREVIRNSRGIEYDSATHNHTTVPQITREEHNNIQERDHRDGFTHRISEHTGKSLPEAQAILDSRRLLGYISKDDNDIAPRAVLFAYDENWNLINDGPAFTGYTSQTLLVPLTLDHKAYDRVLEPLAEDMSSRCGLTLRYGWPKP